MSQPTKRLGRFEIASVLGRGGMGTVYLATDPIIGRQVAIKEIQIPTETDDAGRAESKARFEQEFRSAGTLSHSSIVTIYDVGQSDDAYYIAMEYIAGRSLSAMLRAEGPLAPSLVVDYARQIAAGLDFAHGNGIVHRDIKPANILIGEDGRAMIADFGIAKLLSTELTQTGTLLGTPAYMSPEQVRGQPVHGASDQFAFAVILYQMLTGEPAFAGENPSAILYKIVNEPVRSVRERDPSLPPGIDDVLQRALAKSTRARFPSCRALAEALALVIGDATLRLDPGATQALQSHATDTVADASTRALGASVPGTPTATVRLSRPGLPPVGTTATHTPKRRWLAGTAIAVVTILALGAWLIARGRPNVPTRPSEQSSEQSTPLLEEAGAHSTTTDPASATADPTSVPPPGSDSARTRERALVIASSSADGAALWLDDVDTGQVAPTSLTITRDGDRASVLTLRAPDGVDIDRFTFDWDQADPDESDAVHWQPRPLRPALQVTSEPAGARVMLDGRDLGLTTPTAIDVSVAREHRLSLALAGYQDAGWTFSLAALSTEQMQTGRLHFPLQSTEPVGVLDVQASYPLVVEIGDRRHGPAARHSLSLPPRRYRVTLVAEEVFLRQTYPITLTAGERTSLKAPRTVSVRIAAAPANASVTIDGQPIDDSLPTSQHLAIGRYTFVFSWQDGRTRRTSLTVSQDRQRIFGTPE